MNIKFIKKYLENMILNFNYHFHYLKSTTKREEKQDAPNLPKTDKILDKQVSFRTTNTLQKNPLYPNFKFQGIHMYQ